MAFWDSQAEGHSRVRVAQVADAMRVTAAVAPRVASGDPAASKGKSAGGASFGKRRVGQEERCAAPPVFCCTVQNPEFSRIQSVQGFP